MVTTRMMTMIPRRPVVKNFTYTAQTKRLYHISATNLHPTGWFASVKEALVNIIRGDEHKNPIRRLERKYIYYALLTMQYRKLRLENKLSPGVFDDYLYEKATDDLEKEGLDALRIMELRRFLQRTLESQVIEIFDAFQKVDERLKIADNDDVASMDFQRLEYKQILLDEFLHTSDQLKILEETGSLDEKSRSMGFLQRKKSAINTLLGFHGWDYRDERKVTNSQNNETEVDDFGIYVRETSESSLNLIRRHQTINLCRSALLREEMGYSVISLQSLIPGGGRGLFLDGKVMAGSLVAFQPGDVWPKEHYLADAPEIEEHFEHDPDYNVSLRFDEYVIDSRQSPVTVLSQVGSMNPWALGHMANHPPKGIVPNCLSTMVNITESVKMDNFIKYSPNTYAMPPTWQSKFFDANIPIVMHGLGLLSRRDLCNEELLYDYRLQTDNKPKWYSVVKYQNGFDEDQVVFLGKNQIPGKDTSN